MSLMLASVTSPTEALTALGCGADWIDVKDPSSGALGAATDDTVAAIVAAVSARAPVSATIGESWTRPQLIEERVAPMHGNGVDFVKAGLAARDICAADLEIIGRAATGGARLIIVCMAEAPPRARDIAALAGVGVHGVMLDTADKDGAGLAELLTPAAAADFVDSARTHGLLSGLAGRLRLGDIRQFADAGADYLGFRGALCTRNQRTDALSRRRTLAVRAGMNAHFRTRINHSSEVA